MRFFSGKRVLVVGGSRGIGRALALHLASRGSTVCIAARNPADLADGREALRARSSAPHCAVELDVCAPATLAAAREQILDQLGGLDVLVCGSGYARAAAFLDTDPDEFSRLMAVNYLGHVNVVRCFAPVLARQGSGDICLLSSLVACLPIYGYSAYAASKGAIAAFAESLRQEMKLHGVRVGVFYPPTTDTPGLVDENRTKPPAVWALESQSGWNRIYTAEEVARAIARCIERGVVDGSIGFDSWLLRAGRRFLPGLVRRLTDGEVQKALAATERKEAPCPT
jgi:3-dehydrosphinganine reductase